MPNNNAFWLIDQLFMMGGIPGDFARSRIGSGALMLLIGWIEGTPFLSLTPADNVERESVIVMVLTRP